MEETLDNKKEKVITKGYDFLRQLCAFNADYTAYEKRPVFHSNRVTYILHQLEANGIKATTDYFLPIVGVPDLGTTLMKGGVCDYFANVVVEFEGINKEVTTVFLAHHDVANKKSENAQDNTASVANLLDLCVRLSKNKPVNNVVVAFVDAEEIVAPRICGSQRLAQNILKGKYGNVKYAVNLELSANGQNYWMSYMRESLLSQTIRERQPNTHRVMTPYNDSMVIEREGISSVCIGSLDNANIAQAKRGGCFTWSLCHRMEDTFESQAVESDMDLFVNYLETLI